MTTKSILPGLVSVTLIFSIAVVAAVAVPAASEPFLPPQGLALLAMEEMQEAHKLYDNWPNTGPIFVDTLPWRGYLGIATVLAMAYGIMWLAEDPPSPCMVASAAYDSPMAGEIFLLRRFRDAILLNTTVGTAFVDVYYRGGGLVADYVTEHAWAARAVRTLLYPVLFLIALALFVPELLTLTGIAVCAAVLSGMAVWRQKRKRRATPAPVLRL